MTTIAISQLATALNSLASQGKSGASSASAASDPLLGLFSQLLDGQTNPGNGIGQLISSFAKEQPQDTAPAAGEAAPASNDPLAALIAALPAIATVNPEKGPKSKSDDDTAALTDNASALAAGLASGLPVGGQPVVPNPGSRVQTTDEKPASMLSALSSEPPKNGAQTAIVASDADVTAKFAALGDRRSTESDAGNQPTPGNNDVRPEAFSTQLAQAKGTEHETMVRVPLHSAQWNDHFADKVVWLARNDQQSAQINISPPQLGPIQITLNLVGDQASAAFASPHAEVRQAIETALPQLREMLASAGINLGNADVGSQLAQQNPSQRFPNAPSGGETAILTGQEDTGETGHAVAIHRSNGLVDLFA